MKVTVPLIGETVVGSFFPLGCDLLAPSLVMFGINAGILLVYFTRGKDTTEYVKTRNDCLGLWNTESLILRLADCVILE